MIIFFQHCFFYHHIYNEILSIPYLLTVTTWSYLGTPYCGSLPHSHPWGPRGSGSPTSIGCYFQSILEPGGTREASLGYARLVILPTSSSTPIRPDVPLQHLGCLLPQPYPALACAPCPTPTCPCFTPLTSPRHCISTATLPISYNCYYGWRV